MGGTGGARAVFLPRLGPDREQCGQLEVHFVRGSRAPRNPTSAQGRRLRRQADRHPGRRPGAQADPVHPGAVGQIGTIFRLRSVPQDRFDQQVLLPEVHRNSDEIDDVCFQEVRAGSPPPLQRGFHSLLSSGSLSQTEISGVRDVRTGARQEIVRGLSGVVFGVPSLV